MIIYIWRIRNITSIYMKNDTLSISLWCILRHSRLLKHLTQLPSFLTLPHATQLGNNSLRRNHTPTEDTQLPPKSIGKQTLHASTATYPLQSQKWQGWERNSYSGAWDFCPRWKPGSPGHFRGSWPEPAAPWAEPGIPLHPGETEGSMAVGTLSHYRVPSCMEFQPCCCACWASRSVQSRKKLVLSRRLRFRDS